MSVRATWEWLNGEDLVRVGLWHERHEDEHVHLTRDEALSLLDQLAEALSATPDQALDAED